MIPIGTRRIIERVEKRTRELRNQLRRVPGEHTDSELDLELHDLCRSLSDCCDQVANEIWLRVNGSTGSKKPNIYWPVTVDENGFRNRLAQQQMGTIEQLYPEIYSVLKNTQSWQNPSTFIPSMKKIANGRHSRNLDIQIGHKEYIEFTVADYVSVEHEVEPFVVERLANKEMFGLLLGASSELRQCCAVIFGDGSP